MADARLGPVVLSARDRERCAWCASSCSASSCATAGCSPAARSGRRHSRRWLSRCSARCILTQLMSVLQRADRCAHRGSSVLRNRWASQIRRLRPGPVDGDQWSPLLPSKPVHFSLPLGRGAADGDRRLPIASPTLRSVRVWPGWAWRLPLQPSDLQPSERGGITKSGYGRARRVAGRGSLELPLPGAS